MRNIDKYKENLKEARERKTAKIENNILTYERVAGYHFVEIHTVKFDASGNTILSHNVSYKSVVA